MNSRKWHTWISVVLMMPLFVVGATAVFIAHEQELGTEQVVVNSRWLPEMQSNKDELLEVKDWLLGSRLGDLAATKDGVYRLGEPMELLAGFPNNEFRQLVEDPQGNLWAVGKMGVWRRDVEGQVALLKSGDFHAIEAHADRITVFEKKTGVWQTGLDGLQWTQDTPLAASLMALPVEAKTYNLKKLIMDLHTGKAFFGKSGEWIWIDVLGVALVLLSLTGGTMWWQSRSRGVAS